MNHFIRKPAVNLFGTGQIDWPNPRDSIGKLICSNGSSNLWRAIGPARKILVELRDRVLRLVESCGYESPSSAIWTFWLCMTGACEERTRPHLLFVHNDRAVYHKIRSLIKDSGLMKDYPSVTIGEKNTLKLLAAGLATHDPQLMGTRGDFTPTIRIFGNRIFEGHSSASVPTRHVATIGGIVRHGSEIFIFSAGHPFISSSDASKSQAEHYLEEGHAKISESAVHVGTVASIESFRPDQIRGRLDSDSHMPASDVARQEKADEAFGLPQKIHRLNLYQCAEKETSSIISSSLDYILFKLSDDEVAENLAVNTALSSQQFTNILRRTNIVIPEEDDDVKVICRTASDRFLTGTLDGTPSRIRLPNKSKLCEVYEVQFDGPLAQGDCGAWVLDAGTGGLYGHIIAGLELQGIAYVMPARDVFDNAQASLNQGLLIDCDIVLEALLGSDHPEFRIDHAQASVVPKGREQPLQIASLPTPDVMSEDIQHGYAIPRGQTGSRQSASGSRPDIEFCRAPSKQTPSDEGVQKSKESCSEIDAARTPINLDPSPEPQYQGWSKVTSHHHAWPAEFRRRRELDYAMENVPYVKAAELAHDETMVGWFMQEPEGYDDGLSPRVDIVTNLCRGKSPRAVQEQQEAPIVAWLDERSFENGQCLPRAYQGPLTAGKLYSLLNRPVGYHLLDPGNNRMLLTFSLHLALSSSTISRNETG